VRRALLPLAVLGAAVGALVAVVVAFVDVPRTRVLDGYVLFLGSLLLLGLVRATRLAGETGERSVYELALRRRERPPARPPELAKLEREVSLATGTSFDVHYRLRPVLREVAAHRLSTRRGLALDGGSPEVPALLGPELWELVRPDREPPADRFARGLPLGRIELVVRRLETI
jgi:hypothetical protein